jgi:hypothetical protein
MYDDEIWDEFKWEEFLKEQDKKVDLYTELFYRYQDDPNRDEIIAREMGWSLLLEQGEEVDDNFEFDDELEEGEEWKVAAGIKEDLSEFDDLHKSPLYQKAHSFAVAALRISDKLPERFRSDSSVVDFISNAAIAGAKIAGGTAIGDENLNELGCSIAYCKRGLVAANLAIAALREMKRKKIIGGELYLKLVKEATEIRNGIASYVLELREKFNGRVS